MKTFLQIVQDVYREGGISGQINSVQNQTGEALRVVKWVQEAYREICNADQYQLYFLRGEVTVQLTPGKAVYTKDDLNLPLLGQWDTRSMRVSLNANKHDETFVFNMRWPEFRDYWLFSSRRDTFSRPLNCSVDENTHLRIAPVPDAPYYLSFQQIIVPPDLIDSDDVPIIPDRWQMAIVWRALRHYGMYESAPEVVMRADSAYNEIMLRMTLDQSPEIVVGGPLC